MRRNKIQKMAPLLQVRDKTLKWMSVGVTEVSFCKIGHMPYAMSPSSWFGHPSQKLGSFGDVHLQGN